MIRIKIRLVKVVGVRMSVAVFFGSEKHFCIDGDHVECTYECVKPREPKIFKIGHLPAPHLLPNHVDVGLYVVHGKIKRKS
jgi:hypothetical protein